jgi:catechol 2,3-dioxygenase-like lactoylglutathione lyase family enzyme
LTPHRKGGGSVLENARIATRIPAQDLERARRFYSEKLGLEPVEERPGGLLYRCASGDFALFESAGASPGTFTQMAFEVDDLETVVADLRARGLEFEYEGVAEVEGHYPSKGGRGERAVWFRDSENNMMGIGQAL